MRVQITLKLLSALGTPLHSDTLWGHLAWQLKYRFGEQKLRDFLNSYQTAPTLISSGFPMNLLPKPILPPAHHHEMSRLIHEHFGSSKDDALEGMNKIKKLRKMKWIREDIIVNPSEPISEGYILAKLLQDKDDGDEDKPNHKRSETVFTAHNTINRWTFGTLEQGGLFFTQDTFYDPETTFRVFMETDYFTLPEIEELFADIGLTGYGRDASTGKGAFTLLSVARVAPFENADANAVMSLSNFIPTPNVHWQGFYELVTKYGKLGGDYVRQKSIPFKKPVVMFAEGSVLLTPQPVQEPIGTLIRNVHFNDPDIVQYAYLFPLPIRVKTGEEAA